MGKTYLLVSPVAMVEYLKSSILDLLRTDPWIDVSGISTTIAIELQCSRPSRVSNSIANRWLTRRQGFT